MKWSFSSSSLLQQGAHIEMRVSATPAEIEEGKAVGLDFPELSVRALIETGAALTIINPQIAVT